MTKIQMFVNEHKKLLCIMGLLFIVGLECCVFPVGNLTLGGGITIGIINFAAAIGIGKCVGDIEAAMLPKATWIWILFLNFVITIMGMVARYFLEYGEVSNTYNFTLKNIVVHVVIMLLLSMTFWMQAKRKAEKEGVLYDDV